MKKYFIVFASVIFITIIVLLWQKFYQNQTDEQAREALTASGMNFYDNSIDKALQKAIKEKKNLMIYFYASWCGVCKKMKEEVFSNTRVNTFYNANFVNMALNIEKEGKSLSEKYEVSGFPAMIFINEEGKIIQKIVGFKNVDEFLDIGKKIVQ